MKKFYLAVIIFCSFGLRAQDSWTDITPFGASDGVDLKHLSLTNDALWFVGLDGFDLVNPIKWGRGNTDGENWAVGNVSALHGVRPSSICGVSATTAYIAVHSISGETNAGVWVTIDSGQNWTKQITALFDTPSFSFPNFVHFYNPQNGVVVGDPAGGYFEIYVTGNGGNHWTRVPTENIPLPIENEVAFANDYETNGNSIWFSTSANRIFRSVDMGVTWTVHSILSFNASSLPKCAFKDNLNGLLVTRDEYVFYRTADGGENWSSYLPDNSTGIRNGRMWNFPGTSTYLLSGQHLDTGADGCSYSVNNGSAWTDFAIFDSNPVIPHSAAIESVELAFCVGRLTSSSPVSDKRLYKFIYANLPLSTVSFVDKRHAVRLFPNPTKDFVYVLESDITSITVFDTMGQMVINQTSFDGTIDLSACRNGVYFAKIVSKNNTYSTVKIVKH